MIRVVIGSLVATGSRTVIGTNNAVAVTAAKEIGGVSGAVTGSNAAVAVAFAVAKEEIGGSEGIPVIGSAVIVLL